MNLQRNSEKLQQKLSLEDIQAIETAEYNSRRKKNLYSIVLIVITVVAIAFYFASKKSYKPFTDNRDGKVYKIVKIGNQVWMAQNLAYKATSGCWAYENDEQNATKYGYLYNWETANKVCPQGWHLPSDAEWNILINSLGGEQVAGGNLKSVYGWNEPNAGATDNYRFSAFSGGYRNSETGKFSNLRSTGSWWSSTSYNEIKAWYRYLYYSGSNSLHYNSNKNFGYSVRCIRNETN